MIPTSLGEEAEPLEEVITVAETVAEQKAETPAEKPVPAPEKKEEPVQEKKEEPVQEKKEEPAQEKKEETVSSPEQVEETQSVLQPEQEKKTEPADNQAEEVIESGEEEPKETTVQDEEKPADDEQQVVQEQGTEEMNEAAEQETLPEEETEEEIAEEEQPELPDEEIISKGTPPDMVDNLKVINPKPKELTLTWDAVTTPKGNADGYEVRWGTTDSFTAAAGTAQKTTSTSYNVTELTCGQLYYYWVRAYYNNTSGNPGDWSDAATLSYTTSPDAPTNFKFVLADNSAVKLVFSWDKEPDASGYYIYRYEGGIETQAAKVNKNVDPAPTKTVGDIVPADELVYRIRSYIMVNGKEVLSENYDEYKWEYKVPAVNDFKVESAGKDSIKLSWTALEGATKYTVLQYNAGDYVTISEQTSTSFTDTGLTFGKEYTYYIVAWVGDYQGKRTSGVTGQARGVAPENIAATNNVENNSNKITWSAVDSADGYILEWSTDFDPAAPDAATWNTIDVGSTTSYIHEPLTLGEQYSYHVCAFVTVAGSQVKTPWSSVVSTVAKPPKVTNLNIVNTDYKTQDLTWDDLGTGISYEVNYSTSSSFPVSATTIIAELGTASYTHNDCENGTRYYYRVRAYVTVASTKRVYGPYCDVASFICAPAQPVVTAAYTAGVNQVTLSWPMVIGATKYRVAYKQDDGNWKTIGDITATTATTQTYLVKNLVVGSVYYFGVSSIRSVGGTTAVGQRGVSAEVHLKVDDYIPTELTYTVVNQTTVKLTWKAVDGISLYAVSGSCPELPDYKFDNLEKNTNNIQIRNLQPGYNYTFTVKSKVVVDNEPVYSLPATLTDVIPTPLAPTELKATVDTEKYGFNLTWAKAEGASGYIIEFSESADASVWLPLVTIEDADTLSFRDNQYSNIDAGKTFFYHIMSYVDHGGKQISEPSAPIKVIARIPKPVLEITGTDTTKVSIDVTNTADIENGSLSVVYYIYRSNTSNGGYKLIADNVTSFPYEDTVKFGTVYYYRVRGVVTNGGVNVMGLVSNTGAGQGRLKEVTGLTVTEVHGGSVKIQWNPLSGATGYRIVYKEEGGAWKLFGTAGKATYEKLVTGLNPQTKYYFMVAGTAQAGGATRVGNYSAEASETTKMEETFGVKVRPVTSTSMIIAWTATADATGYQVYVKDPKVGTWERKAITNKTNVTLTGLGKNKQYDVKVCAYINRKGIIDIGDFSSEEQGNTGPVQPTGLRALRVQATQATLIWNVSAGADGYEIHYRESGASTWSTITVTGARSYVLTGLTNAKQYEVRVWSYGNEDGNTRYGRVSTTIKFKTLN